MADEFPELVFLDELPPSSSRSRMHNYVAEQARLHPGKWVAIPKSTGGMSSQIMQGKLTAFRPEGHWEAATRKPLGETVGRTFVRYVGPVPDDGEPAVVRSPARMANLEALGVKR